MKAKESIDTMLAASARPQNTKSGSVILRSGNRRHILVNPTGQRTKLGDYYDQKTSADLPVEDFDPTQAPFREGNAEYIKMRNGEERVVRRYDPFDNEYRFTKLGKTSTLV